MSDEIRDLHDAGHQPIVVHPGPASIEDLLDSVDPAPDYEIEHFVAAIYAQRRDCAEISSRE